MLAAIVCLAVSGCADQQPTTPMAPRVTRGADVTFNRFFTAWSRNFSASPILTQNFTLDARQTRQFGGWWPEENVLAFARANPGRLYINGDEPDQWCMSPYEYAGMYNHFVEVVSGVDPTARFSPAGFAEPNEKCCPPGDEQCAVRNHSIGYADQFYAAHIQRYGVPPRVDEWRFHDFGLPFAQGDVAGWWARVDRLASWSVSHGANMVLGAWAFHRWKGDTAAYLEYMKQAMGRIMNDSRINEAVYWSYEIWAGEANYLANDDGSLTPQGQTYANPLTDVPTNVTLAGFANGQAKLQWNNTTSAWGAEAEFWVKTPGASDYVYHSTVRVAGPGAVETPLDVFRIGDSVRGRVRYYHAFGQAGWSPFSNSVLATLGEANKGSGTRKSPRFCSLPTGQSQPCA